MVSCDTLTVGGATKHVSGQKQHDDTEHQLSELSRLKTIIACKDENEARLKEYNTEVKLLFKVFRRG